MIILILVENQIPFGRCNLWFSHFQYINLSQIKPIFKYLLICGSFYSLWYFCWQNPFLLVQFDWSKILNCKYFAFQIWYQTSTFKGRCLSHQLQSNELNLIKHHSEDFKLNKKSLTKLISFLSRMMRKIWMTKLKLWKKTPSKQKLMRRIKKSPMAMVERKRKIVVWTATKKSV